MANSRKTVVFIAGPTASGKSAFAIDLAVNTGGVIINADSMQLYRDLRLLTARPGVEEEKRCPHRLYGLLDGAERCSVARWRDMAMAEIERAWAAEKLPILVGGTGLYFKTLDKGIAEVPEIPEAIREETRIFVAKNGPQALHARLAEVDPELAARLAVNDRQRIARGWEVWRATGTSLSVWQSMESASGFEGREDITVKRYLLSPEREELYRRCDRRFAAMLEDGAIEEVRQLMARGLDSDLPVMKALGVQPIADYLAGEITIEAATAQAQQDTRRYAKRQMTWFRHQCQGWEKIDKIENINEIG